MLHKGFVSLLGAGVLIAACGGETSSPFEGGCASDADCKGDRVCDEGVCRAEGGANEPSGVTSTGATTSAAGTGAQTTTSGGANAPVFLDFGTSVSALSGLDAAPSVTFTAVLTDPDGVDDLIGGTLKDESGAPYGAFATSGQEGAYALTLTWDQINATSPIGFAVGMEGRRSFVAEFFDVAGHRVESTATLTLDCAGVGACDGDCGRMACGGSCVYVGDDANCGACGNDCGGGSCSENLTCFGYEGTDSLCSDGLDNDGDGYFDCVDYNCSKNPNVSVCG